MTFYGDYKRSWVVCSARSPIRKRRFFGNFYATPMATGKPGVRLMMTSSFAIVLVVRRGTQERVYYGR